MKDDDSSSIVRSQTAHQVNVSEYTGNATTPQNHVTSDVDRELAISEPDAGPAREINSDAETHADEGPHARLSTPSADAPPADASDPIRIEADTPVPASDPSHVPVDAFQDELAAIERARDIEHRQRVATKATRTDAPIGPTEPVPGEHLAALHTTAEGPHIEAVPTEPPMAEHSPGEAKPALNDGHALLSEQGEALHTPELDLAEHSRAHPFSESLPSDNHAPLPTDAQAQHLEAVATEATVSDHHVGEAKPVFGDNHALLPEQDSALQDPGLDLAELGHAHPLSDPESSLDPASPHAAREHLHTPPPALSPTGAALADLNKDEFQGRLAGIKREVQALNDRLTDFEAELDKDQIRSARP